MRVVNRGQNAQSLLGGGMHELATALWARNIKAQPREKSVRNHVGNQMNASTKISIIYTEDGNPPAS